MFECSITLKAFVIACFTHKGSDKFEISLFQLFTDCYCELEKKITVVQFYVLWTILFLSDRFITPDIVLYSLYAYTLQLRKSVNYLI